MSRPLHAQGPRHSGEPLILSVRPPKQTIPSIDIRTNFGTILQCQRTGPFRLRFSGSIRAGSQQENGYEALIPARNALSAKTSRPSSTAGPLVCRLPGKWMPIFGNFVRAWLTESHGHSSRSSTTILFCFMDSSRNRRRPLPKNLRLRSED